MNIDGIRYATAQIVARRDGRIYMQQIPGIPIEIAYKGKVYKNLKPKGSAVPIIDNIYLLTPEQADHLFLPESAETVPVQTPTIRKTTEAGVPRQITIGVNKAAESPADSDFENAAVYVIENLPAPEQRDGCLLEIGYRGDVARLYSNGKLIADNFYYGRPMLLGLWRLPDDCTSLELRILPLQPDMPVYFPGEADITPGEAVNLINIIKL